MGTKRENERFYWLKLMSDFFSDTRIKRLRNLAGGDTYIVIYLKLALLAVENGGVVNLPNTGYGTEFIEELSLTMDEKVDNVSVTVSFLVKTGLLEMVEEFSCYLPEVAECIGSETASTRRSRKSRENRGKQNVLQCNTLATHLQHTCNTPATIEKKKEKNQKKEKEENLKERDYVPKEKEDAEKSGTEKSGSNSVLMIEEDSFEYRLTEKLIESCRHSLPEQANLPKTKTQIQVWAIHIQQLKMTGYTEEQITKALEFALTDSFWSPLIRTTKKFKQKFEILYLKAMEAEKKRGEVQSNSKFRNFEEREYDMDNLTRELMGLS